MMLIGRSTLLAALAALILCACTRLPAETHRLVPGGTDDVQRRIAAEMSTLGLVVTTDDGVITGRAEHAPGDWATCGPALVGRGGGEHSSRRLVSVSSRQATVRVTIGAAGPATRVEVRAAFSASYVNPERGGIFDRPCRSQGLIEARILEAAA